MKRRAFSSWWRRIISQASAPSGGQSRGPAVVALPRRAPEAGLPAASLRPRSAPPLSWSLGATLPRGVPLRDHLLLEPSAPAHLNSGVKGGTVLGASHVVTVLRSHGTGTGGSPRQTLPGRLTRQRVWHGALFTAAGLGVGAGGCSGHF